MADVKWIKVTTDIFDDEKILLIESMPAADSIITIWFKLLVLAGKQNNDGVFLMNSQIPYTDEMLATIFRRDLNTVRMALNVFEKFGMVEIIDNVITIPNWGKHQTLDAYERKKKLDRERIAKKRAEQKLLIQMSPDMSHDMSPTVAKSRLAEEDKEEDRDKEREEDKKKIDYDGIKDAYNSLCPSLPAVKSLSDARRKAIKARLNSYTVDDLNEAFMKAEASDFLKGKNDRNWRANFDWILKDANIAKILDGLYDNRQARSQNKAADKLDCFYDMAAQWAEEGE